MRWRKERSTAIPEAIPEAAVESVPATSAVEKMGDNVTEGGDGYMIQVSSKLKEMTLPSEDTHAENPDKTEMTTEDEEANMKPGDPKNESAVSGGGGLPPPSEKLPATNGHDTATRDAEAAFQANASANTSEAAPAESPKQSGVATKPQAGRL